MPLFQMEHCDQDWKNNNLCNIMSCSKTFNAFQRIHKEETSISLNEAGTHGEAEGGREKWGGEEDKKGEVALEESGSTLPV